VVQDWSAIIVFIPARGSINTSASFLELIHMRQVGMTRIFTVLLRRIMLNQRPSIVMVPLSFLLTRPLHKAAQATVGPLQMVALTIPTRALPNGSAKKSTTICFHTLVIQVARASGRVVSQRC